MGEVEFNWSVGDEAGSLLLAGGVSARFKVAGEVQRNGRVYFGDADEWMSDLKLFDGDGEEIQITDVMRTLMMLGVEAAMRKRPHGSRLSQPTEMDRMQEHADELAYRQSDERADCDFDARRAA